MSDTSIIFVIDPPREVARAILLLASIRRHLPDTQVICYCPAERTSFLPPQFSEFLEANNAELRLFETAGKFDPVYPRGNRILACAEPRDSDYTLFLDTKTAVCQEFDPAEIMAKGTVAAAAERFVTWGKPEGHWPLVYGMFDFKLPELPAPAGRRGGSARPYLSTSVMGFPNAKVAGFGNFGALWLDTAQQIDANEAVPSRRPWLDQIALPVAIARAGWDINQLENRWNLRLPRVPVQPEGDDKTPSRRAKAAAELAAIEPVVLNYQSPENLEDTKYAAYFDGLAKEYTCFANSADLSPKLAVEKVANPEALERRKVLAAIPKEELTEEQKAEVAEIRQKRRENRKAARGAAFAAWPASILPETR